MRRSRLIAITTVVLGFVAVGLFGVGAGADQSGKPPAPSPNVVTIDDGAKEVWMYDAWLDVPNPGVTVTVGPEIPEGKRLVIETVSVWGNGSGPVTQAQGIERLELTALGAWTVAIPLDRYYWGECPGFEPPENCNNYNREWNYAGTQALRAYVDSPNQLTAFAQHPGDGTQNLTVQVIGFLVPVPST